MSGGVQARTCIVSSASLEVGSKGGGQQNSFLEGEMRFRNRAIQAALVLGLCGAVAALVYHWGPEMVGRALPDETLTELGRAWAAEEEAQGAREAAAKALAKSKPMPVLPREKLASFLSDPSLQRTGITQARTACEGFRSQCLVEALAWRESSRTLLDSHGDLRRFANDLGRNPDELTLRAMIAAHQPNDLELLAAVTAVRQLELNEHLIVAAESPSEASIIRAFTYAAESRELLSKLALAEGSFARVYPFMNSQLSFLSEVLTRLSDSKAMKSSAVAEAVQRATAPTNVRDLGLEQVLRSNLLLRSRITQSIGTRVAAGEQTPDGSIAGLSDRLKFLGTFKQGATRNLFAHYAADLAESLRAEPTSYLRSQQISGSIGYYGSGWPESYNLYGYLAQRGERDMVSREISLGFRWINYVNAVSVQAEHAMLRCGERASPTAATLPLDTFTGEPFSWIKDGQILKLPRESGYLFLKARNC